LLHCGASGPADILIIIDARYGDMAFASDHGAPQHKLPESDQNPTRGAAVSFLC
jgi:hypothetical protein